MARKMIIAGNWKMNKTPSETRTFIEELKPLMAGADAEVVCCVPAIDIIPAVEAAKGSNIVIGAENMYFEEKGAFTGEIAPNMLVDAGVTYVILGHSERREYFAETNETVNKKVKKAFEHGLKPIVCCGETLTQREQGITLDWIRQQIKIAFLDVTPEQAKEAVIAYEPIWAIGTGQTATPEQ
ncbi:MAG: triose-phosphate isomerase, partial [Lachnospiraceae bacterium]|nr:triose-phosphate isomerase [Lachnospiraceae bacterium]